MAGPVINGSGSGKKPSGARPRDGLGEIVVEFLRDVAGELEMLLLVLADRHMGGVIEQNVGGHQVRIDVESDARVLAVLAGLLLELGHAIEPADARDAIEDPGELGVARHLALIEDDVRLRIDARGDERGRHLAGVAGELVGVLEHGDGVQIDHAIEAVMLGLKRHELGDGAEIIAEMQIAGRLHAGEYAGLFRCMLRPYREVRDLWLGDSPAQSSAHQATSSMLMQGATAIFALPLWESTRAIGARW